MPQVPSKRYDLFIQFFEQRVTEAQKKIEELREFEPLYNVAREVLEKYDFKNDIRIVREGSYLSVKIVANPEDHYKDFIPAVKDMCKELIRLKLRATEISYNITKESAFTWTWFLATNLSLILAVKLIFDKKDNKYLKIVQKDVLAMSHEWEATWLEKE